MTSFKAFAALLFAPLILAQATTADSASATTTSEAPSCTASIIATLCDYKTPGPEFAVASTSKEHCWEYCNKNQPCNFVIFVTGNPYLGTGTCWVFPGEEYDPSLGTTEGCSNQGLTVYGKPQCASPTESGAGGCAATASPSAVAEVCDYPPPDEDCYSDCYASSGASSCLSLCAKRSDSCAYAVFVARNPSLSPYASGTCWIYPQGTFDKSRAGTCNGKPYQFVYENKCPKPKPKLAAPTLVTKPSPTESKDGSKDSSGESKSSSGGEGSSDGTGSSSGQESTGNKGSSDGSLESSADSEQQQDGKGKVKNQGGEKDAASGSPAASLIGLVAVSLVMLLQ